MTRLDRRTVQDRERVTTLLQEYGQTGDTTARDELVAGHVNLVRFIARKFIGRGESLDDLYQVGLIGLVKAIERYDGSLGAQFITFATPTIMGEIKRHLRDHGSALKLSRHIQELIPAIARTVEDSTRRGGVAPTAATIAARLGVTEERVLEAVEARHTQRLTSLDAPRGDSAESTGQKLGTIDHQLLQVENHMMVEGAFQILNPRERTIIYGRYFKHQTQSEIARIVGVSQMHVCRMERAALKKMRTQLQKAAA